jgi:hypothetical protein
VAHPVRDFQDDGLDYPPAEESRVRFPLQTVAGADHIRQLALPPEDDDERSAGFHANRLAVVGGASVVILSLVAGTPLAGLAVLGCAVALKKALWAFGNYVLDNVLDLAR